MAGYGDGLVVAAPVSTRAASMLMSSAATGAGRSAAWAECMPGWQAGAAVLVPAGARLARACRQAVTPRRVSAPRPSGHASARACRAA